MQHMGRVQSTKFFFDELVATIQLCVECVILGKTYGGIDLRHAQVITPSLSGSADSLRALGDASSLSECIIEQSECVAFQNDS